MTIIQLQYYSISVHNISINKRETQFLALNHNRFSKQQMPFFFIIYRRHKESSAFVLVWNCEKIRIIQFFFVNFWISITWVNVIICILIHFLSLWLIFGQKIGIPYQTKPRLIRFATLMCFCSIYNIQCDNWIRSSRSLYSSVFLFVYLVLIKNSTYWNNE